MAILTRVLQSIFGSTAGPTETGVIGSEDAGSPATSSNLLTIQSLSQYLAGMYAITGGGTGLPKIEDFNSLFLLITSQLAYIFQNGVPEYDATTNYYNNISYVQVAGVLYQSISGTSGSPNIGNAPASSPSNWRPVIATDSTFAANSDLVVPSQKAVKSALTLYALLTGATFTGTVNGTAMILSGALTALTFNKLTLTQPATGATLTLADGKTITEKSSRTIQGTDGNLLDTDVILRNTTYRGALSYVSTTTFSLAPGGSGDDTFISTMFLSALLTKSLSAWAVGNNNGSLDTGAIAASTGYYVYLIKRPDTQVVDVLISLSATAPTMPTNYTLKRLVGWVLTNGSSQLVQWLGYTGGEQAWQTLTSDINDSTLTTARKTYTIANLPNVAHDTKFNVNVLNIVVV